MPLIRTVKVHSHFADNVNVFASSEPYHVALFLNGTSEGVAVARLTLAQSKALRKALKVAEREAQEV